ncbi:MAG: RNA polymerase sigma-70 factor [Tannerellaceae bacterium]|jgi:RNA polymerase sigma-70 factor (ECF subfamily)|nr:RNA polymerase sigma-70 factor [Tannerellaceae bacterium]
MERNDESYLTELAKGSHEAFRALFMQYFPKVKFFINQLIKSETIAEELAQDVFMKLWEYRQRLSIATSFNAYIFRMAKNSALNHLEHKYLEDTYAETLGKTELSFTIESEIYARELELLEQLIVAQMPPRRKSIYELSRKKGLRNDEIAAQLGISPKTVENQLNIALKTIRKRM